MLDVLEPTFETNTAPEVEEWLDYETSQFIENELTDAADSHYQWLADVCGLDDLFDVRAEMRAWWNDQVRSFRSELRRQIQSDDVIPGLDGWHEDLELESRRQLAFVGRDIESLF